MALLFEKWRAAENQPVSFVGSFIVLTLKVDLIKKYRFSQGENFSAVPEVKYIVYLELPEEESLFCSQSP